MPTPTRLIVRGAPLPPNFKGNLNQFYAALLDRLQILNPLGQVQIQIGGVMPTSNLGPWLKDGTEWWVYDEALKTYRPVDIASESLRFIVSDQTPDPNSYDLWIKQNVSGVGVGVFTYYGGAWRDVYADTFANMPTNASMNAAISAAIASALSGITVNNYPNFATLTGGQAVPADATPRLMNLDGISIGSNFNLTNHRFIAPVAGVYHIDVISQIDAGTATPSGMNLLMGIYKNGVPAGESIGAFNNTPSPNGARWAITFGGLIQLAVNDYLECWITADDGVGSGSVQLVTWDFSVFKVQ